MSAKSMQRKFQTTIYGCATLANSRSLSKTIVPMQWSAARMKPSFFTSLRTQLRKNNLGRSKRGKIAADFFFGAEGYETQET
jgi:hypothetical protein